MPNHVTNRLEFDAEYAPKIIYGELGEDGQFDFNTLIPRPLNIYRGNIGSGEEKDFKDNTWYEWNIKNWGTKWNAYGCSIKTVGDKVHIQFDTAWSVPYPVIIAFANKFEIPFIYKYFDEGWNFWGIEHWVYDQGEIYAPDDPKVARRKEKLFMRDEDFENLCIELKGYEPEKE